MFRAVSATDPTTTAQQVLADAEDLHELDAARAELWVSGLLADLTTDELAHLLETLQEALQDGSNDTARLLAAVISVVADADAAARAANICSPADIAVSAVPFLPVWASLLGQSVPVDARAVVVEGVRRSVIVRFAHSDDDRHLMLVELAESRVADLRFAPDGLFDDELGDESIEMVPVPLEGLGQELGDALAVADLNIPSVALNRLVARRRLESLGADLSPPAAPSLDAGALAGASEAGDRDANDPEADPADREGDAAAVELLESALAKHFATDGPSVDAYAEAASKLRDGVSSSGEGVDIASVFAAGGLDGSEGDELLVLRFVSAYAKPRALEAFSPEEREAISHLEWADWLGAVIGLTRAGAGTEVSPQGMVKAINRCPEITTTIPKADAEFVAWSFELTLHAWSLAGVLDDDEQLTGFGASVLPRAYRATWRD